MIDEMYCLLRSLLHRAGRCLYVRGFEGLSIATFKYLECKILFESVITERIYPKPPKPDYTLADEIVCLWYGYKKSKSEIRKQTDARNATER